MENPGEKELAFGYGGHPGFRVPLEEGLAFEDYCLDFGETCQPLRVGMSDACFIQGPDTPLSPWRRAGTSPCATISLTATPLSSSISPAASPSPPVRAPGA